ncbi:MAG: formate dehydrogenase, partial [Actinomycetota bacterium]|nr:formate dehydrogenase [Actinomycetota bacterium]
MTTTTGGPRAMRTAPTGAQLADLLETAGLTGRGGAAYSTATKLRSTLTHSFDLVVNACDGEIGAVKDAWVVANRLDEVERGVGLLGARSVRWAAHRDSGTHAALLAARLDVLSVPPRYVSSEESALVSLAHGGLARPVTKHVPVSTGGVDGRGKRLRPTLVLNAETV